MDNKEAPKSKGRTSIPNAKLSYPAASCSFMVNGILAFNVRDMSIPFEVKSFKSDCSYPDMYFI